MANAVENARKRLASLREEIARVERFIAMYEEFSGGTNGGQLDAVKSPQSEETFQQVSVPVNNGEKRRRHKKRRGPAPGEIVRMIERLMREVGQPLTRGEIVDALEARDVAIPAKDKDRYVGTLAWRHKSIFVNIDGRGYWLRDEPLRPPMPQIVPNDPEATYDPDDPASSSLF